MCPAENKEMAALLVSKDYLDLTELLMGEKDDMYSMGAEKKAEFYKNLAYHLGTTDSVFLHDLIDELKYWDKR